MKTTKKVASIILSFLTLVSAFTSMIISTNAVDFPTDDVSLHIHKYAMPDTTTNRETYMKNTTNYHNNDSLIADNQTLPDGAVPVKGVEFTIYKVGDSNTKVPANNENKGSWELKTTVVTDNNGLATFGPHKDYGLYYVEETNRPANIEQTSVPFFVYLPLTNAEGQDWLRDVHVYPKNIYLESAAVFKKTYDGKTIAEMQATDSAVGFKSESPTKVGLFAKGADSNGSLLATITLTSDNNDYTATPTGTANSNITFTETAKNTEAFKTIEITEYKGIILVNHLIHKDNDYYFQELQGGTLGKGEQYTNYSINDATKEVTVKSPPTTVRFNPSDHTIVKQFVAGVGTGAGNIDSAVTECTLNNSTVPNNIEKYVVKTSASNKTIANKVRPNTSLPLQTNAATSKDSAIINSYESFSFMIKADVVKDVENYDRFTIEDTINSNYFTIKPNDIKVTVCGEDGSKIGNDLVKNTNYKFENESNRLKFSFIDTSILEENSAFKRSNAHHVLIEIPFTINDANIKNYVNRALENSATLTYSFTTPEEEGGNSVDKNYNVPSDPLYVGYLGAWFKKVDDKNTALGGAKFKIKKDGTELNIKSTSDPANGYEIIAPGAAGAVESLNSASGSGDIYIYGLDLDQYTLTESQAPTGYQLLKDDINFTVSNTTALTETPNDTNKRQIVNLKKPDLPATGGIGTIIFTIAGITAIVGCIAILLVHKKKKKANI